MVRYELNSTIHSPGSVVTFIEFSPDGRFVAIGDHSCSLYILDKLAGFHPTISSATHARPTALVWETTTAFYVGLGDGCFFYYQVDLNNKRLVEGAMNKQFRGPFPITAIALDAKSETLVSSLGPGVYAFKRKGTTSMFLSLWSMCNGLTLHKVNFASLQKFRPDFISNVTLECHPRSLSPFAFSPTMCSSSHIVNRI